MYSIRHASLTLLATVLGVDKARMIAGHAPGSTTLERYYLHFHSCLDIAGASLEEQIDKGGVSKALRTKNSLAVQRLATEEVDKLQGPVLNEMIKGMMATN